MTMAHFLSDLVSYFNIDEIEIDNWNFKLFYKVSTALCLLGASIGVAQSYFGKPITCEFSGGINGDLANDYCWMHGSAYIPVQYQAHMGCIIDQEDYDSDVQDFPGTGNRAANLAYWKNYERAPKTEYYQWVTFIFAIQAASFYLPYKLWSGLEGGLIESFGTDAKSRVMIRQDSKLDDSVILEAVTDKWVKYFKSIFHRNNWYFVYFVLCEVLNYLVLMINIAETNNFLNHKFKWYGMDVFQYYNLGPQERKEQTNPMCATFPTEVSCSIPKVGAAGGEETHNGLCVLTQNIINEKIYLIMWFWWVTLSTLSALHLLYRILTIVSGHVRYAIIYKTIHHSFDEDLGKHLQFVLETGHTGDWFVLQQLSKNTNPYFFREFIRELSKDLKQKPKQSLSNTSSNLGKSTRRKNNAVLNLLTFTSNKPPATPPSAVSRAASVPPSVSSVPPSVSSRPASVTPSPSPPPSPSTNRGSISSV